MKMADRSIMPPADPPCRGCTDRWVTSSDRCHSTCEKYRAWSEKWQAERKEIRDRAARDSAAADFEITSAMKTRRKKKAAR